MIARKILGFALACLVGLVFDMPGARPRASASSDGAAGTIARGSVTITAVMPARVALRSPERMVFAMALPAAQNVRGTVPVCVSASTLNGSFTIAASDGADVITFPGGRGACDGGTSLLIGLRKNGSPATPGTLTLLVGAN